MAVTETGGACGLMSSGGFGPAETKAVCTRLATKPWIRGFTACPSQGCVVVTRVGGQSWRGHWLSGTSILQLRFCRPAGDLVCVIF